MSAEQVKALARDVPPESASSCELRSRYTEDRLAAARGRLDQYVVLGAGADSYALRMGSKLGDLTVFEVDDPTFLAWKRQRIRELGLKEPEQLRFTPCDFETTSVADALAAAGFDAARPCFISWLGVTQYLTPEATAQTLRWAGQCAPGSEIVLTFQDENARSAAVGKKMAEGGVTSLTHFLPEDMLALLRSSGFTQIDYLPPEIANERYFRDRADGLRAPMVQHLVSATI